MTLAAILIGLLASMCRGPAVDPVHRAPVGVPRAKAVRRW